MPSSGEEARADWDARFDAHIEALRLRYLRPFQFLVKGSPHGDPDNPAFGLNTNPPEELWNNINETAHVLDRLAHQLALPIIMTTVYRSPKYNAAAGGTKNSAHMKFNAIDFCIRGSPVGPAEWAAALHQMRSSGQFSGAIGIHLSFVHVDTRGTNLDWIG